jgi:hypothetical protein
MMHEVVLCLLRPGVCLQEDTNHQSVLVYMDAERSRMGAIDLVGFRTRSVWPGQGCRPREGIHHTGDITASLDALFCLRPRRELLRDTDWRR